MDGSITPTTASGTHAIWIERHHAPGIFDPPGAPARPSRLLDPLSFNIAEAALAATRAYDRDQDGAIDYIGGESTRIDEGMSYSIDRLARAADTNLDGTATANEIADLMATFDVGQQDAWPARVRHDGRLTDAERDRFLDSYGELSAAPVVSATSFVEVQAS